MTKSHHVDMTLFSQWDVNEFLVSLFNFSKPATGSIYMGYWPSVRSRWLDLGQVLFLHVYKNEHTKKERGPYPAILTEQAWSIKDLLYGIKHHNMINVPCGTQPVSRAGKIAPSCPLSSVGKRGKGVGIVLPPRRYSYMYIQKIGVLVGNFFWTRSCFFFFFLGGGGGI